MIASKLPIACIEGLQDSKMSNFYQLYRIVLIVALITQSACVIPIFPGQIPGGIIPRQVLPGPIIPGQIPGGIIPGQVLPGPIIPGRIIPRQDITGQDQIDQQQELFLIEESASTVAGTGVATGSAFPFLPIPLLVLAVPMMAMAMMTMMSTVTSGTTVAPAAMVTSPVTVPTTQAAVQPTPCVPQSCPAGYQLLNVQTASPNCYYAGDSNVKNGEMRSWYSAQIKCSRTPGANLWRPNSQAEAEQVMSKFGISLNSAIWTGAYSPGGNGQYVFVSDNSALSFMNLPFGTKDSTTSTEDCVDLTRISVQIGLRWNDAMCKTAKRFVCEFPRKTCP